MKTAKKVEVPLDRPLTLSEYNKLTSHAYNSASYYVMMFGRNSFQIREKLEAKGYPSFAVQLTNVDGSITEHDLIQECINTLEESCILNDYDLAYSRAASLLSQGRGFSSIRSKLYQQRFPSDMIEKVLDEHSRNDESAEMDGLNRAGEKVMRSSSFRKLDYRKGKEKLVRHLVSRGFSLGDVYEWISENYEEE